MAARIVNWLAVLLGGAGGTLAATFGAASTPAAVSERALPLRPIGQISADISAARPAASSAEVHDANLAAPDAVDSSSTSAASATSAASTSAKPAPAPATSADTAALPTTAAALLRAEMRCDQGKSESCIIAARSYESGSAGATDQDKGAKYRRIALTMWISHCDHNSAAACATLARMYRAGEGVPRSNRNADALVTRAKELCRFTTMPVCHELEGI